MTANDVSRRQVLASGLVTTAVVGSGISGSRVWAHDNATTHVEETAAAAPQTTQAATATAPPEREIIEVVPGIYRTRQNLHFGLLIVGAESVAVFDTIDAGFAAWLDGEIKTRFGKSILYVIYSHNHPDHVSGGEVFAHHSPRYVAHRLARDSMIRMQVATQLPDMTFDDRLDLDLDGERIELRYHGANDGRGSISLLVPGKRVLSVIDWVLIGRVPFRLLNRYNVDGMIASLYDIEALDFDVAVPGHADMGDKDGIRVTRRYLEALRDSVIAGLIANKSVDEIVPEVREKLASVAEFKALKKFDDWVEENIRGTYRQIAAVEGFLDG